MKDGCESPQQKGRTPLVIDLQGLGSDCLLTQQAILITSRSILYHSSYISE